MVDLSGGSDGPLEHAFSNSVFIVPGIIVIGLSGKTCSINPFDEKMADENQAPPSLNLGGVISEKLKDSIKNMDLVTVLQKMVATTPEDEESEEIRDKLRGVLKQYENMDSDEKERLTNQIKDGLVHKLSMKMKDGGSLKLDGFEDAIKDAIVYRLYLIGFAVLLFVLFIVFFGYKLYKSIKEKETKREEKKKLKQMKKKK